LFVQENLPTTKVLDRQPDLTLTVLARHRFMRRGLATGVALFSMQRSTIDMADRGHANIY
jgi:hypothetical protein